MPDKSDEEIRKSIKKYEESLSDSERNPNVQEDTEHLIERAAQPLATAPIIRKDIPFYPSHATKAFPEGEHCVAISLKMILKVLMPEREFTLEELERITHKAPEGGAFATHYLIWLADQGFEIKRWDTHDWKAFQREGIDYIRRTIGDGAADYTARTADIPYEQSVVDEFLDKVTLIPQKPTVEIAEKAFREGWVLRAPVNSRILDRRKGYMGHSVVIVGFDGDNVIFHDPGMPPKAARRAPRELFQKAMDSFGGELDAMRKSQKNLE